MPSDAAIAELVVRPSTRKINNMLTSRFTGITDINEDKLIFKLYSLPWCVCFFSRVG